MPLVRNIETIVEPVQVEPVAVETKTGPLVSLLLNTIDRYDLTVKCIGGALANCGYSPIELLVCDNGSKDQRVIEL